MKRIAKVLLGAVGLTALSLNITNAADYSWKMATIAPESSAVFKLNAKYFTDKVRLWSNGRLDIKAFGAGVLAHPFKLYDAVKDGQVDIAWSYPGFMVNADPTNAARPHQTHPPLPEQSSPDKSLPLLSHHIA